MAEYKKVRLIAAAKDLYGWNKPFRSGRNIFRVLATLGRRRGPWVIRNTDGTLITAEFRPDKPTD